MSNNNKKWKKRFPEKRAAHRSASNIPRIEGYTRHHWSYNREHYRDIIWVTRPSHYVVHDNLKYDKDLKMYKTPQGEILETKEKHLNYINKFIGNEAFIKD